MAKTMHSTKRYAFRIAQKPLAKFLRFKQIGFVPKRKFTIAAQISQPKATKVRISHYDYLIP
jgi:hypothetical protein